MRQGLLTLCDFPPPLPEAHDVSLDWMLIALEDRAKSNTLWRHFRLSTGKTQGLFLKAED